jgi:hypothetical protein
MYMSRYAFFAGNSMEDLDTKIAKTQSQNGAQEHRSAFGWLSHYKQDRIIEHRTLCESFANKFVVLQFRRAERQRIQNTTPFFSIYKTCMCIYLVNLTCIK